MEKKLFNSPEKPIITAEYAKKLSRRISDVNKRLLNSELILEPIEKLEKEALRGCTTDRGEKSPKKRRPEKQDLLSKILSSEHKISGNACILKLPKMPFGKHLDYNEDSQFVLKHFINTTRDMHSEQANDLNEITKKFRLNEKRVQNAKRNKTGYNKIRYPDQLDSHDMAHGVLLCPRENQAVKGYVNDKIKYQNFLNSQNTRKRESKTRSSKVSMDKSVERLHSSGKQIETDLSLFFKTKYSGLFSKTESKRNDFSFESSHRISIKNL